jgi:hypothetical protein
MLVIREIERIESRVLGAVRFVDTATGNAVDVPLQLEAPAGTQIVRNHSGLHVISRHPALASHSDAFSAAPADPPVGDVELTLTVNDFSGAYLSRTLTIALPRDARPDHAADADSLFRPVDIELYRSPTAACGVNWAALRVSLSDAGSGDALGGALLRVVSNDTVLARGVTDWRGEALVPVVGIAVMTWSENADAVTATGVDATLEALYDDAHGSVRTPAADVAGGTAPALLPAADPDAIESSPSAVSAEAPIHLVAGKPLALALHLDLPA